MDAKYLKENVNDALIEALTSLSIALPEDGIEYIGKYLLQWVKRKDEKAQAAAKYALVEEAAAADADLQAQKNAKLQEKKDADEKTEKVLATFIENVQVTSKTKQEAMDSCCKFLAEYLNIPCVTVAVRKVQGEAESLNYYSSNPGKEHIVGNKIMKPVDDGEEAPERQGCSFDAFKLPEIAEEEPADDEDPDAPPKVKEVPKMSPLVVDNCMRDKRIKFFGVPKLGAYCAVPLEFESCDHELGYQSGEPDENGAQTEAKMNKINVKLIIGMNTIGKYRPFSPNDVQTAQAVGDALVKALAHVEEKMFTALGDCVSAIKPIVAPVNEAVDTMKGEEETFAAESVSGASEEEKADGLTAVQEANNRALFWTQRVINAPISTGTIALLDYSIPCPPPVARLFFSIGSLLNVKVADMKDACGDISWEAMKYTAIPSITKDGLVYSPQGIYNVEAEAATEKIRAACDAEAIFDPATYPGTWQVCVPLSIWLSKNLAAREAAIKYHKEVRNEELEFIV